MAFVTYIYLLYVFIYIYLYIYIYSQMLFQMAKLTKLYQNVANDKNNINQKYKNVLKYVEPRYAAVKLLPRNATWQIQI